MSAIRAFTHHARSLSRARLPGPAAVTAARSFHSPFITLSDTSPLTLPPSPTSTVSSIYEKDAHHHTAEPQTSHNGTQTYVVSQPDPADTPYEVPSGAYPTSAPYENFVATERPEVMDLPHSSTSPNPAHPTLSRMVPRNDSGVGESAAVRNAEAPGELGNRGGSDGGLGLMDNASTKGENKLAERNPPPLQEVAEKFSKRGLEGAWKTRR
ncbi:hypothetical protein JAAARDRAFT_35560 [Jaapia argillacea MUCL 33604]|uniref:Uncharacterized protein n=1 Tax=Jaapia argillacea MUCL 33604 TaxID=933084 RepID=A0A067Q309_9AGAM|nr:hypothetical protein JAAARDRAFT_35560 [Jaapia argillacea MUCL 33604]